MKTVNAKGLRTTLGELIALVTEEALQVARTEGDAYRLAGLVLSRMRLAPGVALPPSKQPRRKKIQSWPPNFI